MLRLRAAGHGLVRRLPRAELVSAFAAVGLRRTKETLLAVAARVEGVTTEDLDRAVADRRLVAVYGARGTTMLVPAEDVAVFTLGTAPADEESLRAAIPGAFLRRLDAAGMTATDALAAVVAAVHEALAAGPRPRGDVAMAVTRALPATLTPPCRGRCPDPHVEDSLFRLAGVNGAMCFDGDGDVLVGLAVTTGRNEARAEFVRRYLRGYGPSKPAALAEWAGISPADARRSLAALGDEVVDVAVDGRKAGGMLRAQAPPAEAGGLRFLPPYDAFLLDRDRSTLVPDRDAQKRVWRAAANPGVVVVDGEPVATWKTRQRRLLVEPLGGPLPDLGDEPDRLADLLQPNG